MKGYRLNPDAKHTGKIISAITQKGGYCPCRINKDASTLCPCDEFIGQGLCRCNLFIEAVQ